MTNARQALGRAGEAQAAAWYRGRGYDVIAQNWRRRDGEIDLIAARGSVVVFCEVKTRSSERFGSPAEGVQWRKQRRLRRLAAAWLSEHHGAGRVRFDVAEVTPSGVSVIEDAF
ncbi:MAG: YraN family protein [Acidimicrobiales bacterium]